MTSDVVVVATGRRNVRGSANTASRLSDRERLAVGSVAAAIALLPLLRPAGPTTTAPVDAVIAFALLVALFWLAASRRPIRLPYALPLGAILLGGALGAIAGPVPATGAIALVQDVALLLWFWAVINVGSSVERLEAILRAWAYAAIGWAVVLLGSLAAGATAITGQIESEGVRTALTFGNPNLAGNYFFVSMMIVWATARPRSRVGRLAAYALLMAALVSTGSISALIAVVVGTTIACGVGVYRRAGVVAATTALACVALAGVGLASTFTIEDVHSRASRSSYAFIRDGLGRSAKSASDRGLLFHQSVHLYQTGGPLGTGPGSTKVRLKADDAHRAVEAHNDYLATITERGILGSVGVFLLLGGLVVHVLSLARAPASGRIARAIVRPNALAGAIAGTLVAMATTEYLHVRHVWTLFAFVVAAALVARES